MFDFLTDSLRDALNNLNTNLLYEIRVRANKPTVINYNGRYGFLSWYGFSEKISEAIVTTYTDIESIIYRASEYSVYSVTEQLQRGFLTGAGGERIGLAGEFVYENGSVVTVKEITSINIRIPHQVKGCADFIFKKCFSETIGSALIVSPPGRGKTTILRDLTRLIANKYFINILVDDERNEISATCRDFCLDTGPFTDVIKFSRKKDALSAAVRSMRPDLIITDELVSQEEVSAVCACIRGGVHVIASAHFKDYESVRQALMLKEAVNSGCFSKYIILSTDQIGKVWQIYDNNNQLIFQS